MFDQEHYENLLKGLFHWQGFVTRQKPGFCAKLRGADLEGATLTLALLRDADLVGAFLDKANLSGAILAGADLKEASLENAVLKNATLENADLTSANLKGADLRNSRLCRARLTNAHVHGAVVHDAIVETTTFLPAKHMGASDFAVTDLGEVRGLTQKQLNVMRGDSGTRLPKGLVRPAHWPDFPGVLNGERMDDGPRPKTAPPDLLQTAPSRPFRFKQLKPVKDIQTFRRPPRPRTDAQPTPPFNPDRFVFLSYKREDRAWVQTLRDSLIQNGIPIWWDDDIPGDRHWDDEIDAHLERATIVLTVWTDKSVASREVKNEALYAIRNAKLVQVQTGNPKLGPRYEAIQCSDLSAWTPSHAHPDFDRLVDILRRRLDG